MKWRWRVRLPQLFVIAACALIIAMYWRNEDNAQLPDAPRGTGQYLPILDRGDGHMMYLMARSTALDLDWDFENDLRDFGDPWAQRRNPTTERKEIPHPIGPPLIWTPLIWIAHAGSAVANLFGADIPRHGYTEFDQRFVFLSSVLAGLLAALLGGKLARKLVGGTWAPTYATVCVLLGTSLTYYATYMPSYGHALDAGACAAFLATWALTFGRWEWRRWIVLGVLLGIAMLIRVQDVAFGVVIVVEIASVIVADLRKRAIDWRVRALIWLAGGATTLAIALVVFVPQLYYWHVIYGDWLTLPQGSRYTRLGSPMILELLFAPRNGWFSTHPIAYLSVIGLACVPRRARLIGFALALALVIQVYLNSTIIDWWAMASWGQRRMCSVSIILVVGLAALVWRLGRLVARVPRVPRAVWHVIAIAVLGSMVAWNIWRVRQYRAGRSAPADLAPTCCTETPKWARSKLQWIYNRIGNPFEFPASWWFAWKHDAEIQRWDHAVGYYALVPPAQSLRDDTMYDERGAWRIGFPLSEPYLLDWWSGVGTGGDKPFRWTMAASSRAIVPNLMPYPQHFSLLVAPGGSRDVTLRWDGDVVARAQLADGWQRVEFDIDDMTVGEHELAIEATLGRFPDTEGWPRPRRPVGVAVNTLEVTFIRR
ncbi:MAG TPA: hypothetical protein VIV40_03640 [Kofleriaceae bacterium]